MAKKKESHNIDLKFEIESLNIADIWQKYKHDNITLRPDYQRKIVWSRKAQIALIETVLLGYPIPEIYLAYQTDADGEQQTEVVDGQQRLTSIIDFIRNEYFLVDLDENLSEYEESYFRDLPAEIRKGFFEYRIPVRRLNNMNDEFVRSVFARVNKTNIVLKAQELRNALMPGPFLDFLKDCVSNTLNVHAQLFSEQRSRRGGDLEFYAEVFSSCVFALSNKKKLLDAQYDEISTNFDRYSKDSREFLKILDFLDQFVKWSSQTRWSNIVDMFTLQIVAFKEKEFIFGLSNSDKNKLSKVLDLFQRSVSLNKKFYNDKGAEFADELKLTIDTLSTYVSLSGDEIDRYVNDYNSGVRNSSDLSARRIRHESLKMIILSLK